MGATNLLGNRFGTQIRRHVELCDGDLAGSVDPTIRKSDQVHSERFALVHHGDLEISLRHDEFRQYECLQCSAGGTVWQGEGYQRLSCEGAGPELRGASRDDGGVWVK